MLWLYHALIPNVGIATLTFYNMETIQIEDWALVTGFQPYQAPEQVKYRLVGIVEIHPRLKRGGSIQTSSLVGKRGECVITATGSIYKLGRVRPPKIFVGQ